MEFAYSKPEKHREVGPYVRNTYLMHIVTKGVCRFCDFDAYEGEAFIISKNKLHSFVVEPEYEHYWFSFDVNGITDEFSDSGILSDEHMLFEISDFEYLKAMLENGMKYADSSLRVAHSVFKSVLPLLKAKNNSVRKKEKEELSFIAKKFIDNNYQDNITMEIVAGYVCVSEKYLCRKFKTRFGIPPQQYLLSVRMKQAKRLIKDTELKIKEISSSVGYKSQLTFSYAFKNFTGMSPSEYRKSLAT